MRRGRVCVAGLDKIPGTPEVFVGFHFQSSHRLSDYGDVLFIAKERNRDIHGRDRHVILRLRFGKIQ